MQLTSRRLVRPPARLGSAAALALLLPLAASRAAAAAPAPPGPTDDLLVPCIVTSRDTLIGLNRTLFTVPGAWKDVARINHLADSNRLRPGQVLQVPARYLHSQGVPAQVPSAFGDVRIADRPAGAGAALDVGATIRTGESSSAVVQLAEGSHVRLAPRSLARLDEHRRFQVGATAEAADEGTVAATLRLVSGSMEVFASKAPRARPLAVSTPTAVTGARGAVYRLRNDVTPATAAASAANLSAIEVLEGKVHVQPGAAATPAADVPAGFGAVLEDGRKPVALPPAPDLSAVPALFDHLPIKFPVPGLLPVRVQVAGDAAFDHILYDQRFDPDDEVYIPQLADGAWHLRVRAIGPDGLEGRDALRDFRLLARPEAPFLTEPPAGGKRPVGDVTLRWTHNPEAARFVVEVARDARFTQLALHDDHVSGETVVFHPTDSAFGAADGLYWWRVQSVAADGRRGAWSEPQALVLRPTPRAPLVQVSPDGAAIELRWGGRPEDRAEAELARDAAFQQVVARGDYETPGTRLPRPAAGTYFARYRFVEPDGFKTSWSAPVKIEVEGTWERTLGALLPASRLR